MPATAYALTVLILRFRGVKLREAMAAGFGGREPSTSPEPPYGGVLNRLINVALKRLRRPSDFSEGWPEGHSQRPVIPRVCLRQLRGAVTSAGVGCSAAPVPCRRFARCRSNADTGRVVSTAFTTQPVVDSPCKALTRHRRRPTVQPSRHKPVSPYREGHTLRAPSPLITALIRLMMHVPIFKGLKRTSMSWKKSVVGRH